MSQNFLRFFLVAWILIGLTHTLSAEVWLRYNFAGYYPDQRKVIVVMSDQDIRGETWAVKDEGRQTVYLEGIVDKSIVGKGVHTPKPYNFTIDISQIDEEGAYLLECAGAVAKILVDSDPYKELRAFPLEHLRNMRSGSNAIPLRPLSHPGDAQTPLFIPDGDPANGKWKPDPQGRKVDVLGGWYDAGDYIKFSLNAASTTYFLLASYMAAPELWESQKGNTSLPRILEEAKHGLDYLMKLHPTDDIFIIQVANQEDHWQGWRLPQDDKLDGTRPAKSALSRVHMSLASAALALGALAFETVDRPTLAGEYLAEAERIYARMQKSDTVLTAFERGNTNDFYLDPNEEDQQVLAAFNLYRATGKHSYLEAAQKIIVPDDQDAAWNSFHWLANAYLAEYQEGAKDRLFSETARYVNYARHEAQPWGIPRSYVWASLHRFMDAANACRFASLNFGPDAQRDQLFFDVLDYTFGRNNWGVPFLFTRDLPHPLQNLYSQMPYLMGFYPTGAISEGPGNRATVEAMSQFWDPPEETPLDIFDTNQAVFQDYEKNFVCQEATIVGQAAAVLLMTLASVEPQ